ncbi:hypothetical protein MSPP1_000069 [Malassezia sp. CBS 17886]|nr:hypothetical protein MSPP1_000069 [Malassezia sp. CBS 17886]
MSSQVTPPGSAGKSKRQAHTERMRAIALSRTLSTRLRYAIFKMENGWTRQSLSEVENLYYRRQMNALSSHTPTDPPRRAVPAAGRGRMGASPSGARTPLPSSSPHTGSATGASAPRAHSARSSHDDVSMSSTYAGFWDRLDTTKMSPPREHATRALSPAGDTILGAPLQLDAHVSHATKRSPPTDAPTDACRENNAMQFTPLADQGRKRAKLDDGTVLPAPAS